MTNFEAAVELSLNNWVATLPTEFDLPEPTEAYKKGIAKLLDKMRGDRYHKFTRKTARIILIAAIIMAIATVTLAATVGREFIVQKFSNFSRYSVVDSSNIKSVEDIEIGYIPEGFELTNKETSKNKYYLNYFNEDKWISIYKSKIDSRIDFDTEYKNKERIRINGFEGVYFEDNDSINGLMWNNGHYIYQLDSNISKEELIKIAENVK
jgi:hypothetical protein